MISETQVTSLVEYMVLNAPTFIGLLLALVVYDRQLRHERTERRLDREEHLAEITRLTAHNDKLILWCMRCPEPPPDEEPPPV